MEFYTPFTVSRPIRLSEETRRFAYDSLHHKYGKETEKTPYVTVSIPNARSLSLLDRYDLAIETIAKNAPIRICPGEKISGSATLGMAIDHLIPAVFEGVDAISSVSHLTVDFFEILEIGYEGMEEKARHCARKNTNLEKVRFYDSVLRCFAAFRIYHERYLAALKNLPGYEENYDVLSRVPRKGASSFREAVQSLWFTFSFLRLCGNWPGIGRIDVLLGAFLKQDLYSGKITIKEARELLAHFFIKGCEWIRGENVVSGDAQHYQNIVLSGIGEDGKDVTNEVSYLVLDIVEELGIGDFPISVRINPDTAAAFMHRVAEVIRFGGGIIAVYNEPLVLKALTDYGYPYADALTFANDGCWEVQIPGKTRFRYRPFDSFQILTWRTLRNYEKTDFESFETLYNAFISDLRLEMGRLITGQINENVDCRTGKCRPMLPCTLISIFEKDCVGRGQPYYEGGTIYSVISPHIGGLADTVNSLYAFKKAVFDDKIVSFADLCGILKNNWEGKEDLRCRILNQYRYFGNDNDEADLVYKRIIDDFALICREFDNRCYLRFPVGVSTFGRQIEWADARLAAPFGKRKGDILSGNSSPTPGTDLEGVTSVIKSYCKADLTKTVTGSALDVQLLPATMEGEEGLKAIESLLRGFITLGGYFMQIDVADPDLLKKAQEHPEDYPTLSVRVSGWNARFATLDEKWQRMVIERMEN